MSALSGLGCICCKISGFGNVPPQIHHILSDGCNRIGHLYTLPLCYSHHEAGIETKYFVSRHPHWTEFERRYGSEWSLWHLCRRLVIGDGLLHVLPVVEDGKPDDQSACQEWTVAPYVSLLPVKAR